MKTLYVVATPIGNLSDITFRAIETLKHVDVILCEDTRTTKKLLDHYKIEKKTMSYHAQSNLSKTDKIIELLESGLDIAIVSDAGTPGISDPGNHLVYSIQKTNPEIKIVPIPGASALTAVLSASGILGNSFLFEGFIPQKKGRQTFFNNLKEIDIPVVMYESSHRILKALESLDQVVPNNDIVLAKEITKIHEKILVGKPKDHIDFLTEDSNHTKGEFVLIVKPNH